MIDYTQLWNLNRKPKTEAGGIPHRRVWLTVMLLLKKETFLKSGPDHVCIDWVAAPSPAPVTQSKPHSPQGLGSTTFWLLDVRNSHGPHWSQLPLAVSCHCSCSHLCLFIWKRLHNVPWGNAPHLFSVPLVQKANSKDGQVSQAWPIRDFHSLWKGRVHRWACVPSWTNGSLPWDLCGCHQKQGLSSSRTVSSQNRCWPRPPEATFASLRRKVNTKEKTELGGGSRVEELASWEHCLSVWIQLLLKGDQLLDWLTTELNRFTLLPWLHQAECLSFANLCIWICLLVLEEKKSTLAVGVIGKPLCTEEGPCE